MYGVQGRGPAVTKGPPKTIDKLKLLSPERLKAYFDRNARYAPQMPRGNCYFIRIGSISLCCSDTMDLWNSFESYVKGG